MAFSAPSTDIVEEGDDIGSFVANEAITRGQVVKIEGADLEVSPSDTDGENVLGVAVQTVSSGDTVAVAMEGTEVKFTAGTGTVARGDYLTSHGGTGNEGEVDTADATGDTHVGYAYEGSSASGDLVHGVITMGGEVN